MNPCRRLPLGHGTGTSLTEFPTLCREALGTPAFWLMEQRAVPPIGQQVLVVAV